MKLLLKERKKEKIIITLNINDINDKYYYQ